MAGRAQEREARSHEGGGEAAAGPQGVPVRRDGSGDIDARRGEPASPDRQPPRGEGVRIPGPAAERDGHSPIGGEDRGRGREA